MSDYSPQKNVICVTSDRDSQVYRWDKNSNQLSPNLEIVSIKDILSMPENSWRKYFAVSVIEEGMVFIKDPYSDSYYLASEAQDKISESKRGAINILLNYLGAKKVDKTTVSVKTYTRDMKFDLTGKYKVVKLESSVHMENSSVFKRKVEYHFSFNGENEYDYDKAKEFCERSGLIHEGNIRALLETRNPENKNLIKTAELFVSMTRQSESLFDCAFSLNVLNGFFELDANCKNAINMSESQDLHIYIEFK